GKGTSMNQNAMAAARTASIFNVAAGAWLIVSPFVLAYTTLPAAMWDSIIVGIVVLILAWARAARPERNVGLSWLNLLLGLWVIVSPFALTYSAFLRVTWNDLVVGAIVVILAIWSALSTPVRSRLMQR